MSDAGLRGHIKRKREAMAGAARAKPDGASWRERVEARAVADDSSGVRRLAIRDWQYVSDSGPAFGGQGSGPSSPELLCGVIATCLAHTYEIAAATLDVPLDRIDVHVSALNNDAGLLGLESPDPDLPWDLTATVNVVADGVAEEELAAVHAFVRERCPLTKLIRTANALTIVVV
jgi:uncharacterized OsmC-like protein